MTNHPTEHKWTPEQLLEVAETTLPSHTVDCTLPPCENTKWALYQYENEVKFIARYEPIVRNSTAATFTHYKPDIHSRQWRALAEWCVEHQIALTKENDTYLAMRHHWVTGTWPVEGKTLTDAMIAAVLAYNEMERCK